jgi:uroporphyrinogen-III synthase
MRVLVTRQREQAQQLVDALSAQGFDVVVHPLIRVEPLSDAPIDVSNYDCVIVTSPNGARQLARRMVEHPTSIAAIGPGTSEALEVEGLNVSYEADVHTQEGLAAELAGRPGRKLFVGALGARSLLAEELGADFIALYQTHELDVGDLPEADLVLLMSPSTARAYARAGGSGPAISIGPQTTVAACAAGVHIVAEAESHDMRGLVDSAAAWRDSSRS